MPTVSVRIPQIGEGLQEARLVAHLKQAGESVRRDEPIYQMETDKAVMDVESPFEGTLAEWLAQPDEILAIGAEVARMDVKDAPTESDATVGFESGAAVRAAASDLSGQRLTGVPPRTRSYAKEKGLSDADLAGLALNVKKLLPEHIDAFLAESSQRPSQKGQNPYTERQIPGKQRVLNSRMVRGTQVVVPGTITVALNWEPIERLRAKLKAGGGDFQPSSFTMFAFAVSLAAKKHPGVRTAVVGDEVYRTYDSLALGIAVGLPGDELVLAVVDEAGSLPWRTFADRARASVDEARKGKDQAKESVTLSLTNMQNFGLRDAVPVVVPPACATLFLGEVYPSLDPTSPELRIRSTVNLALTFDHRVMNGVGAAQFLNDVRGFAEQIEESLI